MVKTQFCHLLPFQVSLAKPPSDKKKKEEVLRNRERRMIQMMQGRTGVIGYVVVRFTLILFVIAITKPNLTL